MSLSLSIESKYETQGFRVDLDVFGRKIKGEVF